MIGPAKMDEILTVIDREITVMDEAGTSFPHSIYVNGDFIRTDHKRDEDGDWYILIHSPKDGRVVAEVGHSDDPDNATGELVGYRYYYNI